MGACPPLHPRPLPPPLDSGPGPQTVLETCPFTGNTPPSPASRLAPRGEPVGPQPSPWPPSQLPPPGPSTSPPPPPSLPGTFVSGRIWRNVPTSAPPFGCEQGGSDSSPRLQGQDWKAWGERGGWLNGTLLLVVSVLLWARPLPEVTDRPEEGSRAVLPKVQQLSTQMGPMDPEEQRPGGGHVCMSQGPTEAQRKAPPGWAVPWTAGGRAPRRSGDQCVAVPRLEGKSVQLAPE